MRRASRAARRARSAAACRRHRERHSSGATPRTSDNDSQRDSPTHHRYRHVDSGMSTYTQHRHIVNHRAYAIYVLPGGLIITSVNLNMNCLPKTTKYIFVLDADIYVIISFNDNLDPTNCDYLINLIIEYLSIRDYNKQRKYSSS